MAGRTLQPRALTCPNCGAKLRWDRDVPVIECRYCQTHVLVDSGRRTDRATDVVSVPASAASWKVGLAMGGVLVAGSIAMVVIRGNGGRTTTSSAPAKTSTVAELVATPLAATPEAVAARHGVNVSGTTVRILVSDGPFKEASFYWDKAHLDHVTNVTLWPRTKDYDVTALLERARAQLGRRLRSAATGGYQFGTKAVGFSISSSTIQIVATPGGHPAWKAQLEVLWTVMKGAALGTKDTIDDRTRRDVLNVAYPLTVLAEIPFAVSVDDATREVARVAPGADSKGARHTIGLAHPWFESASLEWENEAQGRWASAVLYYPKEFDFGARHPEIVACLSPVLGEPKKLETDHLAKTFTLQYEPRAGNSWIYVGPQVFQIYPHPRTGKPSTEAGFHAVLAALAACGT